MSKIQTSKSGKVTLEISDDGMSAWMTIHRSHKLINELEIIQLLESSGIQYGFEQALRKIRKDGLQKEYEQPFPIALCENRAIEHQLKYYFDPDTSIDPSHPITPEYLSSFTCFEVGMVIADDNINLFENESSIYNIYGDMIQFDNYDQTKNADLCGHNVAYDEKTNTFTACSTGYPYLDTDHRISILDTLVINNQLIELSEPLRSPVSIVINSSFAKGEIVCNGNITINGNVSEARIVCEGDLVVNGDIISCSNPGLHIKRNLICNNVSDSRLIVKEKIQISGNVLLSHLVADKGINGGEASTFISGNAQSCGNIEFGTIGSLDNTETELEITISPYYKTLLMIKTKELINLKQQNEPDLVTIDNLKDTIQELENHLDQELSGFLRRPRTDKFHIIAHTEIFPFSSLRVLKHAYNVKVHQDGIQIVEKD